MSRGRRKRRIPTEPLIIIQWIISVGSLLGGIYVVSPMLQLSIKLNGASAFVQTIGSQWGLIIFGLFFILSALIILAGIIKHKAKWRAIGLFLNGMCRLYAILGAWLAVGIMPLTWLSSAVIMVIVFYIWGRVSRNGSE